ncbi:Lsr2 family DNA-binding protein [Aeromicrobium sp. UBA7512]|uniref:Lsr2 family DNA-binding protein n=1 Tax=Aeromicrobium TaxID=2040 RepID=UPI003BB9A5BB
MTRAKRRATEISAVRAWARAQGYEVAPKGRLAGFVLDAYYVDTGRKVIDASGRQPRRRADVRAMERSRRSADSEQVRTKVTVEVVVIDDGKTFPYSPELLLPSEHESQPRPMAEKRLSPPSAFRWPR